MCSVQVVVQPGTVVAEVQLLSVETCSSTIATTDTEQDSSEKEEALWQLVNACGDSLDQSEQQQFDQLLLMYVDIFTTTDMELCRTDKSSITSLQEKQHLFGRL